jgi:hypothetical protein
MRNAVIRLSLCLILSALVLWGGCVSCPQYFVSPVSGTHDCCHPDGGCKDKTSHPAKSTNCSFQQAAIKRVDGSQPILQEVSATSLPAAIEDNSGYAKQLASRGPYVPFADLNLLHSVLRI